MRRALLLIALAFLAVKTSAGTIATFNTSVGSFDVELYDETKPVTVSNFLKYATSGRYLDQFIHRWVPGFVIQGGGYRVDTSGQQAQIVPVQTFGTITNEAQANTNYSNVYGTIAMARVGGQTNSATSQWFVNLNNNGGAPAHLDTVDGGFTVFGRVIAGTNTLNLFVPPPPTHQIFINQTLLGPNSEVPVYSNNLVYVDLTLRRDVDLEVIRNARGLRQLSWNSIVGATNIVEYTTTFGTADWTTHTTVVGTGDRMQVTDLSNDQKRFYRLKLLY